MLSGSASSPFIVALLLLSTFCLASVSALDIIQVIEIDPQGKTVWRLEGFHDPYDVERLPND